MKFKVDKEEFKVIIAYVTVCILWGSTYLAMRIAVATFPPELFGGIRFITAGALVLIFARIKGYKFPDRLSDFRNLSLIGLIMMMGGNGLLLWVEQWVHSGTASLILATTPLWIAILELLLPGRTNLGFKGWLGLLVGFSGVALLVSSGSKTGAIDIKGGLLLLIASFLWSAGSLYAKKIKPSGSIVTHIGIQMLIGGIGMSVVGIFLGELPKVYFTSDAFWAMIYLIFFGSIAGYSSYIYLLQKWPAVKAGTYAYVNPLVAVLLGTLVLGEPISESTVISTVIILGGVLLVQLSKNTSKTLTVELTKNI